MKKHETSVDLTDTQLRRAEVSQQFLSSLHRHCEKQESLKRRLETLDFRISFIMDVIQQTKAEWKVM
jgi:hypothetical protein